MTYPRPEHYVRPRAKVSKKWWDAPEELTPEERKEFEEYKKACKVIGERLLTWVTSARASCVPASNKKEQAKRIEGIASELLGAVRRAIHSASIANDVWQAYVGLYRATQSIRAAVEIVSALPAQHQYFQEEVAILMQSISDLAPPLVLPPTPKLCSSRTPRSTP
ncbi:hypothetical protein EVC45_43045 [Paraburkholderia sp. UYCP14C]|uniref:hypothetical protein n=1 Tax=Paraburkholderia sp. UYCP14C TaxID=2511130 RepID=UPI00102068B5|nr:hypothetical protein [Paraburkholderia sp. UYCP14C]RZF23668.1 hypothetical protein EVC45_43045 [Paraburkholderia sp. UYCP14C]